MQVFRATAKKRKVEGKNAAAASKTEHPGQTDSVRPFASTCLGTLPRNGSSGIASGPARCAQICQILTGNCLRHGARLEFRVTGSRGFLSGIGSLSRFWFVRRLLRRRQPFRLLVTVLRRSGRPCRLTHWSGRLTRWRVGRVFCNGVLRRARNQHPDRAERDHATDCRDSAEHPRADAERRYLGFKTRTRHRTMYRRCRTRHPGLNGLHRCLLCLRGLRVRSLRDAAAGERAHRHETEKLPIRIAVKNRAALGALGLSVHRLLAGVTNASGDELVCNTRHASSGIPELRGAWTAQNRLGGDLAPGDHSENCLVRTTGSKRMLFVADEPRPHRVLRRLTRERIEWSRTLGAARLVGGSAAAERADEYCDRIRGRLCHGGTIRGIKEFGSSRITRLRTKHRAELRRGSARSGTAGIPEAIDGRSSKRPGSFTHVRVAVRPRAQSPRNGPPMAASILSFGPRRTSSRRRREYPRRRRASPE